MKREFNTPIGELAYCYVMGGGKLKMQGDENDPTHFEYSANIVLDTSERERERLLADKSPEEVDKIFAEREANYETIVTEVKKFWDKWQPNLQGAKKSPKWTPIKQVKDKETDEPIERAFTFNAKTKANWRDAKSGAIRPQIVPILDPYRADIRSKMLEKNIYIGAGSRGIILCSLTITNQEVTKGNFAYGVTAYLDAIQLAKLVPYKAGELDKSRAADLSGVAEDINLDSIDIDSAEGTAEGAMIPEAPAEEPEV